VHCAQRLHYCFGAEAGKIEIVFIGTNGICVHPYNKTRICEFRIVKSLAEVAQERSGLWRQRVGGALKRHCHLHRGEPLDRVCDLGFVSPDNSGQLDGRC
jgi:hypothetical protein